MSAAVSLAQLLGFDRTLGARPYRDAGTITDLALKALERRDTTRPFFLFVNYMEPHSPYLPRGPFDRAFLPQRPLNPRNPDPQLFPLLYDRELLSMDAELGRLLEWMDRRDLLRDSVVIITSDHGEAFGEHGFWWHAKTLYEEVLRVPLYVKGVGPRPSPTISDPVTSADVYRIALRELGFDSPAAPRGTLIAEWYSRPSVTATWGDKVDRHLLAWLEGGIKTIVGSRGGVEIYDLDRDPDERHNLAQGDVPIARARARALEWWSAHPPRTLDDVGTIDERTRDRLRDLGYVE